jgi:hypothetical protein
MQALELLQMQQKCPSAKYFFAMRWCVVRSRFRVDSQCRARISMLVRRDRCDRLWESLLLIRNTAALVFRVILTVNSVAALCLREPLNAWQARPVLSASLC